MDLLEKISVDLKLTELKKLRLEIAIHSLLAEWKEFGAQLYSTQKSFQECLNELESREKNVVSAEQLVSESNKQLDFLRRSIEERLEQEKSDSIHKEKEFHLLHEKYMNDLNIKEEKLAARQKIMENIFEKFQLEQNEVEIIQKSAEKRFEEMKLKEKQLEMQSEELDSTRDLMERLTGLLGCKEKNVKVREKIVDSKEKELELIKSRLDCKEKELEEREKRVDLKGKWSQLKVAREQIENELEEEKLEGRNKETISGQKRTMPFSSVREFKRSATAKAVGEPMKGCRKILDELMKHANLLMVDIFVGAPSFWILDYNTNTNKYYEIIEKPRDLRTVKSRLRNHEYRSPNEFAADVRLTFKALIYKGGGGYASELASNLLELFEEKFNHAYLP